MNTQPNIERIVDEAVALADLNGPQSGSAPTPRLPRPMPPVDQPPVEFAAEEEDRSIPAMEARRLRLLALAECGSGGDEETLFATLEEESRLEHTILATPSRTIEDLLIKTEIWRQAGAEDGGTCDHEHLAMHWPVFVSDIQRLAGRPA